MKKFYKNNSEFQKIITYSLDKYLLNVSNKKHLQSNAHLALIHSILILQERILAW